ncbi:MAG: DUF362 domain-containing protein [Candidatus Omnitrophota bacterium]
MTSPGKVAKVKYTSYTDSVQKALDEIGAANNLPSDRLIIIKPNLTNADRPPVTTNVGIVEAIYNYCRKHTKTEIVIGEGCGSGKTQDTYKSNGYTDLAKKYGIRLIDFNSEKAMKFSRRDALQLKELYIPEIVIDAYMISVPVLKDHSFTVTTIAMKNMFGIAPAPFIPGRGISQNFTIHQRTNLFLIFVCIKSRNCVW